MRKRRSPRLIPTRLFVVVLTCGSNFALVLSSAVRLRGDGGARAGSWGRCSRASLRGTSRPGIEDELEPYLPRELCGTDQGDHGHRPDAEGGKYIIGARASRRISLAISQSDHVPCMSVRAIHIGKTRYPPHRTILRSERSEYRANRYIGTRCAMFFLPSYRFSSLSVLFPDP